jgi:hypothetical protein
VGSINVTVRFTEDELRRLDDLAQRMGLTRSDVVRSLINNFDETLKREVEKEKKKWITMGVVGTLEAIILDPTLVLRFARRNVDILGFPDFLVGMVRVKNRVVVFSHHDRVGHQLLQLVRSKVEEEVKREEMEVEQEDSEGEEGGGVKATQVRIPVSKPIKPSAPHAAPGSHRYKILVSSRNTLPVARPIAVGVVGKSVVSGGGGDAKAASNTSVAEKQKSAATSVPAATNPVNPQTGGSNTHVTTNGGGPHPTRSVSQAPMDRPVGDFAFALIANLYHKRRESLLRFIEALMGG